MDKTEKLLRMMEHPELYSDEELRELLSDEECQELYDAMRLSADAFEMEDARKKLADGLKEEEWARLEGKLSPQDSNTMIRQLFSSTKKIAAIFIGLLMLSGIAYAAIHLWSTGQRTTSTEEERQQTVVTTSSTSMEHSEEVTDSISQTRIFEDTSLDEIVNELGAYYKMEVDIQNTQAHELRIFYKWNRKDNLEEIVSDLNHFDHVNLAIEDDKLIVKP